MSGNFWKCTAVYAPLWFLSGAVQIGSIFLIEAEEPTVVQSLLANFIAICFRSASTDCCRSDVL